MKLTQKEIAERRQKAAEMVNTTVTIDVRQRAVSINKDEHTAIFVMSTTDVDRHGDIVDQESWILEYFETNPSFFFQHDSRGFPIGRWLRVWLEDDPNHAGKKRLVGEAKFSVEINEMAKQAFEHVKAGDLNCVSVGFIPHVVDYDEKTDCFILRECELLECSLVSTPSNRQALVRGGKSAIIKVAEQVETEVKLNPTAYQVDRKRKALHLLRKAARALD